VEQGHEGDPGHTGDPHFWLDPNLVLTYVENIRAGLSAVDPDGSADYAVNAQAYGAELTALDAWIRDRVQTIPEARRLLVTNHESLGYYADRYGLRVVGTIIPSVSSGASPSAQQMVELVEKIRATGAPAVFLESGSNPRLADQLSSEAGILVVPGLYTHSPGSAGAGAGSYIGMMRANTLTIVEALQ
jgi:ABC-type Zn uptake system ZnuABC Zn-binding protein ZnuA